MHHDPRIRAAVDQADPASRGLVARMSRWLGRSEEPGAAGRAPDTFLPDPEWPTAGASPAAAAPAALPPDAAGASLEAMAATLAQLIAVAENQIDGAAVIVGRSADEARAYGRALAHEARAIQAAPMKDEVAAQLIALTQSMIAHTRGAEERLRTMGAELERLNVDLADARTCAERDQLTGLPNRRALEAALARAVAAASAATRALSVAFCDIDHFKQLNDTHGHALGDRVLRLVADCLEEGAGEDVFVGRQGGEEFVMLFEGMPLDEAASRVETIRAGLAGRELKSRSSQKPIGQVTFSAGVAELREGETGEAVLRRADAALYRAKDAGRNRVEVDRDEA